VWVENPPGYSSVEFAAKILEETAVVVTPGTAFGRYGEGYVRFALTVGEDRLREAVRRIATLRL
jgi:aspartate/methionine/tyrosine aminotransferase